MGVFASFKEAIFGKDDGEARAPGGATVARPAGTTGTARAPSTGKTTIRDARARPISEVDVEKRLDGMDGADKLNWRSSIVDLMKLIGIDPDYANRKELAGEMGRSDYEGSAEENVWLHKRVMSELAKAGGKVPASLRE